MLCTQINNTDASTLLSVTGGNVCVCNAFDTSVVLSNVCLLSCLIHALQSWYLAFKGIHFFSIDTTRTRTWFGERKIQFNQFISSLTLNRSQVNEPRAVYSTSFTVSARTDFLLSLCLGCVGKRTSCTHRWVMDVRQRVLVSVSGL